MAKEDKNPLDVTVFPGEPGFAAARGEEVVIGEGVRSDGSPDEPRPSREGPRPRNRELGYARAAVVPEAAKLPQSAFKSQGFERANGAARDAFANVVQYPGSVFAAAGRYHNIKDLEDVYDVEPGNVVPDGLYLIGDNYLVAR